MINIVKSDQHFHNEQDWLSSYWHFSFDRYFEPKNMNFGPLRVFNDDIIQPGKGFGFHHHKDMEIVTYVIEGKLEHNDDQGNTAVINAGEVQLMTAGSGITHSEYNHSHKPLRLLQIWIFTNQKNLHPDWQQKKFSPTEREDKILQVVVPVGNKDNEQLKHIINTANVLEMHQDVSFYISKLNKGKQLDITIEDNRKAYLYVIEGKLNLNLNLNGPQSRIIETRDVAKIEREKAVLIEAIEPTEIIVIDLPEKYAINA